MVPPIGERIRTARELKGLTQKDLGDILGVSAGAVANYENGNREPNLATVLRLADLFGVTTDWLLGREGPSERREAISGQGEPVIGRTRRRILRLLDEAGRKASQENLNALARFAEIILKDRSRESGNGG